MTKKEITDGIIHKVPKGTEETLMSNPSLLNIWNALTPIARNEWICWIEQAKKLETRLRRTKIMRENLAQGKKRPCCWAGCPHR